MGFLHSLQDQPHLLHFLRFCVWLPQACTNYCRLGSKDFVRKSKFHQMCDSGGEKGNFRKKKSALRPAFLKNVSWHRKALFCNTTCDKSLNSLLAHDPNTHTDTCTQSQEATIHFKRNWPWRSPVFLLRWELTPLPDHRFMRNAVSLSLWSTALAVDYWFSFLNLVLNYYNLRVSNFTLIL